MNSMEYSNNFYPNFYDNDNIDMDNLNPIHNYDNYHESRTENQSSNNLLNSYCPYINENSVENSNNDIFKDNDNPYIKLEDKQLNFAPISNNELFNLNNQTTFIDEEESKFIIYFKNNKFINQEHILENDIFINKEKKDFIKKVNNIMDKMKCKGCSKKPKEFYFCPFCNSIFCENCLGVENVRDKGKKYCIGCHQLVRSNDYFIKIPIFNKIISYIESIKENNENLFNNKIQENLDKNVVLCSEEIHKNIKDKKDKKDKKEDNIFYDFTNKKFNNKIDDDDESIYDKKCETKAVYFCMECLKPFCSDCILNYKLKNKKNNKNNIINDNNINNINNINSNCNINNDNLDNKENINNNNDDKNKHNYNHHIFGIDLLKDAGIFDLLYEKNKCEKIVSEIESINTPINNKITFLNQNKENMLLFFDYIKKLYIEKVDEIINKLKDLNQEKTEKINIIKQKIEELTEFLKIIKTKNDLKNIDNTKRIKQLLNDLDSFHKIPCEIMEKTNKIIKFKGTFSIKELTNISLNFYLNENLKKKFYFDKSRIKIKHGNMKQLEYDINKILDNNNDNNINDIENKINDNDNIRVIYDKEIENKHKKKINDFFFSPILINKNNNEIILFKEIINNNKAPKYTIFKKKDDFDINLDNMDNIGSESSFSSSSIKIKKNENKNSFLIEEKNKQKYSAEINLNELKKINDNNYNITFDVYDVNIF